MLHLLFHAQPHASPARGCSDLHSAPAELHASRGDDSLSSSTPAFATVLQSATPPLAPWSPAGQDSQPRTQAPAAAETRIDRDRRQGRRRRG